MVPTLEDIKEAHARVKPYIHETPVITSGTLNSRCGGEVFFKCENFQRTGAFKIRGGCNAVFSLSDEQAARGVVTHSSGNHAAAVAYAARCRGIRADIVMPENAAAVKIAAVQEYGAVITRCSIRPAAREETALKIAEKSGAELIPSYNDYRVICGQGTAAVELMSQVRGLDMIITPLGGGGLTSGVALAAKALDPHIRIIAVEPAQVNDAWQSVRAGRIIAIEKPVSLADGLLMPLRDKTFPVIRDMVDEIVLVTEQEIVNAMRFVYERMKIIIEPSSAVVPAALLTGKIDVQKKRAGAVLSGGNVDMEAFFSALEKRVQAARVM